MVTEQELVRRHVLYNQSTIVPELIQAGTLPDESLHAEWYEVIEWWLVTPFLAELLKSENEIVLEEHDCHWWGRTCSGQAIHMDRVMTSICESFE